MAVKEFNMPSFVSSSRVHFRGFKFVPFVIVPSVGLDYFCVCAPAKLGIEHIASHDASGLLPSSRGMKLGSIIRIP